MKYNEQLEEYGIFATNAKLEIQNNKITIINDENTKRAEIENIDCQKLQEKGVKKIDFRSCTFAIQLSLIKPELCDIDIKALTFYDCYFMEGVKLQNINIEISFTKCDFQQEAIFYNSNFNNQQTITFAHITFNKKADFTGTIFNQNTEFLDVTFKEEANFKEAFFENSAIFGNCDFKEDLNISIKESKKNEYLNSSIKKDQKINFEKNKFNTIITQKEFFSKNVNFKECAFLNKLVLKDYNFNKITFNTCTFQDNVYFNNSIFKDYADFHECEFEKTACFYGVTFDKTPNFSQTIFKGNLNIVNANLNFDFDVLESKIKQEHGNDNKKSLDKFANDFRDSFRVFKNTLIKDNNLLDASNFHKYELYSKELELKHKGNKTIKDKAEKWQLWFYRKLCDHHTDLLLNLKWFLYNATLYVLLLGKIPLAYPVAILAAVLIYLAYRKKCEFEDTWPTIMSSIIFFITICDTPKIILGISNLFDKDLNLWQNLITTIYIIITGLILFSLQKAARKNSIVPN